MQPDLHCRVSFFLSVCLSFSYFCDSYKIPLKMQSAEKNGSTPAHNFKAIEEE